MTPCDIFSQRKSPTFFLALLASLAVHQYPVSLARPHAHVQNHAMTVTAPTLMQMLHALPIQAFVPVNIGFVGYIMVT